MANKTAKTAADEAKEKGQAKAQYIRKAALKWVELNRQDVLAKIRELADKTYGVSAKAKPVFVLDKELADMK